MWRIPEAVQPGCMTMPAGDVLEISRRRIYSPFPVPRKNIAASAGIGITPFLSYFQVPGAYELHHCCKAEDVASFAALPAASKVMLHTGRNSLNLAALLGAQKLDTHL